MIFFVNPSQKFRISSFKSLSLSKFFCLSSVLMSDARRHLSGKKTFSESSLRLNLVYCFLKLSLTALEYPSKYPLWCSTLLSSTLSTNNHNTCYYIQIITFYTLSNELLAKLLWRWIHSLDVLNLNVCFLLMDIVFLNMWALLGMMNLYNSSNLMLPETLFLYFPSYSLLDHKSMLLIYCCSFHDLHSFSFYF